MYVCMYVCMYVMYVRTYVCMYVCMYVCNYVCMYVCYVCMYVRMYVLFKCTCTLCAHVHNNLCMILLVIFSLMYLQESEISTCSWSLSQ